MTKQDALERLRELIQKQQVVLGWSERPISLEELIIYRVGQEVIDEIYEAIEKVYD